MTVQDYPVNHPLAVKLWSKKLAREMLKETFAYRFMGESSNSMIQVFDDTQKGPGDRVRVPLRMQLSGRGVGETESLEGNEEGLVTYQDDFVINDLAHAVRVKTTIDAQRVPFSAREEARVGLQDWYADRFDTWIANHLTGNTGETDVLYTGQNATTAPTSAAGNTRILYGNGVDSNSTITTEGSLSDTTVHRMNIQFIDRAINQAKIATPLIRPIRVEGGSYYLFFMHPNQVRDLRTNVGTGGWYDIQKAVLQGGAGKNNPIFDGSLGIYNNTILHEWTRIPLSPTTSNVRRAVFCGAQSCAMGFGRGYGETPKYVEDSFDYDRQFGVSVQTIAGVKKNVFNSIDFGTIVVSTYQSNPT